MALAAGAAAVRAAAQPEARMQQRRVTQQLEPLIGRFQECRKRRTQLVTPAQRGHERARHSMARFEEDVRKGERAVRPALHGVVERVGAREPRDAQVAGWRRLGGGGAPVTKDAREARAHRGAARRD